MIGVFNEGKISELMKEGAHAFTSLITPHPIVPPYRSLTSLHSFRSLWHEDNECSQRDESNV
jgi:hypothetical protein